MVRWLFARFTGFRIIQAPSYPSLQRSQLGGLLDACQLPI